VEGHVVPMEVEEAQDRAHLVFLPLSRRINYWDRDRWMEELVGTNRRFEEDRRFREHEGYHLGPLARGGVVIFLHRTYKVASIFVLAVELRTLTSASVPNVSVP